MSLKDRILFYAFRNPMPVTLRELYQFGENPSPKTLVLIAQFLQKELPVRFAQRLRDLKRLPYGADTPAMQEVRKCYEISFEAVDEHPPITTEQDEQAFSQMIARIKGNHKQIQHHIHKSVHELVEVSKEAHLDIDLSRVLDSFYMSRLSIRMLTGQYISLSDQKPGMIGMIDVDCSPAQQAHLPAIEATALCEKHYGRAPTIELMGSTQLGFSYVPTHLHKIFVELFKNSMRATCEHHKTKAHLPPIQVVIAEGDDDVSIKVSDRGGGIARDGIQRIWSYTYTTAIARDQNQIAGYGDGLPLCRLYARYFGGDLKMMSMQGFGTDAFLHIHKLGNVDEQLPY